ncbi:MAG: 8-oxo-dGTP diphosphatase [Lentisphaerae bacterium]|nr:8-oxo-dGTP diphosphatase [Lentisphaerota bacterium]
MRTLTDIDWTTWAPHQRATLLFVIRDDQILLIHKKRGLGAGNINGPGGRLEPGETPLAAAIRETEEEIGVIPLRVQAGGELFFQFVDGLALHVAVYRAPDFTGTLRETDEAKPLWAPLTAIPYARMWADDVHWLPLLIAGQSFRGHFLFDGPRMLDHTLVTHGAAPA